MKINLLKKSILFASAAMLIAAILLAQKNDSTPLALRWKKVEQLAEKQLPESALKEVDIILKQAQKEKNNPQVIKALIYKMRFTLEQNPDKANDLIVEFEEFTNKSTDPTEKALLQSMTAELYANRYLNNQWMINRRTEISGETPKDINEWTKNLFFDKINSLLNSSLQNTAVLQKTNTSKYDVLLLSGKDSPLLQPTLFEFLAWRKINILSSLESSTNNKNPLSKDIYFADAKEFVKTIPDTAYLQSVENKIVDAYKQILSFRLKSANVAALINADLERLNYIRSNNENPNSDSLYLNALNRLEKQFYKNESVVEVLTEKATFYLEESNSFNEEDNNKMPELNLNKKTAYNICTNGIKRFPKYKRINLLHNILAQIKQKNLSLNYNKETPLNSALKVKLETNNLSKLQLTVYRVNSTAPQYYGYFKDKNANSTDFPNRTLIESRTISINLNPDFGKTESTFEIKPNTYGIYEFVVEEPDNKLKAERTKGTFVVTDLSHIIRSTVPNLTDIYVLNRQTGLPQKDVTIKVIQTKWAENGYKDEFKGQFTTNNDGLTQFPFEQNYISHTLYFEKGKDCYFSTNTSPSYYDNISENYHFQHISFFTDRSIYRPGQTVHFKGIAFYADKIKQEVATNKELTITLQNTNGQTVSTKTLKTNEFGSVSGQFVLPQDGLNGAYTIQTESGSLNIWVKEYKRPTFEVKIDKPKNEIRFGDNVKILGNVKAYAGFGVADATVKYRVVRTVHHFCWWYNEPQQEIANGTVKTDATGNFDLSFLPAKPASKAGKWSDRAYTYTVYCDVTDTKGETQQGEQSVSVGDKSLFIITEVPETVEKDKTLSIHVSTQTINDEVVNSTLKYAVYSLQESGIYNEKIDNDKDLKTDKQVISGTFDTKNKKLNLNLQDLKSGRYKLVFSTVDAHGQAVTFEKIFILYGNTGNRPPVKAYVWLQTPKTECSVGEKAIIQFGTSTTESKVLYEIMQGNKVLESRWISMSNEIKNLEIPFLEAYGAGVNVQFTFMKDEELFNRTVQITRKKAEKKLSPTLSVFRNKLLPGEKAEWTVTVPETAKDKKAAELLVGMYDASLDAIRPHSWYFNPVYNETILHSPAWAANAFEEEYGNIYYETTSKIVKDWSFDELNWFGLDLNNSYRSYRNLGPAVRSSVRFSAPVIKADQEVAEEAEMISVADVKGNDEKGVEIVDALMIKGVEKRPEKPVQIRTNFNETAFFYPQLRTDAEGNVKFTFTAPESLTRWNMNMLAHTADLYFGQKQEQVVTQKDLMVQMNLPRFVRRSDKLTLSANIINLTNNELNTDVRFELIDPATEKQIILKDNPVKNIKLAGNETKAVSFDISEFMHYELVICKMVATAGNFSDGEQKYLPVLPDKVLVTESLPLTIRNNQTRTFKLESLLKNSSVVDTKNLTIEFTTNPAWYAVQALPTLSAPESENAMDYFTAYYANSLAAFIANSNPKISKVFDQWKNATGSRDALVSNLQKNSELKNMLLEETPWVMAAQDETEQKRQIALLFDLNMQKNQSQQYLNKLLKLQGPNGGFAWYEGMHESRYITQEILLNMARLNRMTKNNLLTTYRLPLTAALKYLDWEIENDLKELKKYNKNYLTENCVDNMQLFYLHLRSEYPEIPVSKNAEEAVKYYTAQSEKYWTSFTLYGKAMMAIVAKRNGKQDIANEILKSLKENALKTDELGMYWVRNTSGYYWNERPIAVQAAIIEAFTEISKNSVDIDEMKIWLLKQKQTQRWDSPSATVNAIYALLLQGSDWLANEGKVKVKLGGKTLEPASTEAGTGYFKETIPSTEVNADMGKISVQSSGNGKKSSGIGWGAVYWQYFQDLDKVEAQGGALKISKKLFVKNQTNSMIPIEQAKLKKGDKVITRLVITTDRNLEFVALKDLRAACFEPVEQRSGYVWREGTGYYQTTKDASTQFFFSFLPKGTYVFEYELWVNNSGSFTSGIASVQCQYAPEFVSHTGGERIEIGK